ncbi:MAG: spore maturation protein A [Oscillospiraceae bacterium]|nr:spore maturation protein A [Oscillospiraceae bacterium]
MSYVFAGLILLGILFGILTGRISAVSASVISSATDAVTLSFSLLGTMALWCGLMQIAEKSGLTKVLAKLLSPILKLLFPSLKKDGDEMKAISMNVTANLLGLGNASTPLGISAMQKLHKLNLSRTTPSYEMIMFVVLNTASVQIIPTTVATLRLGHGATNPFDVLPAIAITSICSLLSAVISVYLCNRFAKKTHPIPCEVV